MEKINFKNKGEPGAIPASAENLNLMQDNTENAINEIKPSIITVGLNSNIEITGNTTIQLDKILSSVGNKFTL